MATSAQYVLKLQRTLSAFDVNIYGVTYIIALNLYYRKYKRCH